MRAPPSPSRFPDPPRESVVTAAADRSSSAGAVGNDAATGIDHSSDGTVVGVREGNWC